MVHDILDGPLPGAPYDGVYSLDVMEHIAADREGLYLRHLAGYRTRLFLDLYWPIHAEWERRLAAEGFVDFEDMLVQAAGHLEAGRADMGYDLVMVDEFQDASRARAVAVARVRKPLSPVFEPVRHRAAF